MYLQNSFHHNYSLTSNIFIKKSTYLSKVAVQTLQRGLIGHLTSLFECSFTDAICRRHVRQILSNHPCGWASCQSRPRHMIVGRKSMRTGRGLNGGAPTYEGRTPVVREGLTRMRTRIQKSCIPDDNCDSFVFFLIVIYVHSILNRF